MTSLSFTFVALVFVAGLGHAQQQGAAIPPVSPAWSPAANLSPAVSPSPPPSPAAPPLPPVARPSSFCSRAASRRRCPSPATFDYIQLPAFQGQWYEVGATAGYRLMGESGDSCTQVSYDLIPNVTGNMSVTTTSLHVSGPLTSLAVQQVAVAVATACSGARNLCGGVAPDSRAHAATAALGQVASLLESDEDRRRHAGGAASSLRQIQSRVLGAMHEVESSLALFAATMANVLRVDGEIAQIRLLLDDHSANATRQRLKRLDDLLNQANALLETVKTSVNKMTDSTGTIISISTNLLGAGDFDSSIKLTTASTQLSASGSSIHVQLTAIHLTLRGIAAARGLVDLATSISTNTNLTATPRPDSRLGYAIQNKTSPGKFQLQLLPALNSPVPPPAAPYWVLSLRGRAADRYIASLVYSCTQLDEDSIRQQMFILSRFPHLPDKMLQQLLGKAASLGIDTDCDDPFLFTLQHGSTCTLPPQ